MFFATPHKGGHGADLGAIAASIAGFLTRNPKNDIMQSLKANDAFPKMLQHNYRHQLGDYSIVSFYEAHGMKGKVVRNSGACVVWRKKGALTYALDRGQGVGNFRTFYKNGRDDLHSEQ